jgi:hypothetical protein
MTGWPLGDGPPMQTAFVTHDIHAAMRDQTRAIGAGPWFLREGGVFPRQTYRGQPVQTRLSIAMAYAGDMLIELIQQHDEGPSVYGDLLGRAEGFHHFGIAVEDYAAACAAQAARGLSLVYEAEVAHGARVGYFERAGLPFMVELIQMTPQSQAMFAGFREAHRGWDGTEPVRPLAPVRT